METLLEFPRVLFLLVYEFLFQVGKVSIESLALLRARFLKCGQFLAFNLKI